MNTQDNTLLAEFMGMINTSKGWEDTEQTLSDVEKSSYFTTLRFDSDVNWLIRVLKRIDDLDVKSYVNAQGDEEEWEIPFRSLSEEEKEVLYNKCIHFVMWWESLDLEEIS